MPGHPEAQRGVQVHVDQGGGMPPELEHPARSRVAGPVQQRPIVGTQAREQRHVVRPHRDVDGVDLELRDPIEHALGVPRRHGPGRTPAKSLSGQRDPAGLAKGEL